MGFKNFVSTALPSLLTRSLLIEFQHLGFELVLIDLCCEHLNAEVFVVYPVLFVFISLVYHVLVDIKDAGVIDEPSIEPELECLLPFIEKSDLHIIVGQYFCVLYQKVMV